MGFLRQAGLFGAAIVGVIGGHMLIRSLFFKSNRNDQGHYQQQQQQPQQPQVQYVDPLEALKYADYRSYNQQQQNYQNGQDGSQQPPSSGRSY